MLEIIGKVLVTIEFIALTVDEPISLTTEIVSTLIVFKAVVVKVFTLEITDINSGATALTTLVVELVILETTVV
ncbi:hypothetical protein CHL78_017135 [Romboutsia weinsteinii]|uniref:Uncharacterized protein n=1 Tax=Romboutsia weinsteinii TaxID=2020949 RepID=A0A371IYV2_9FIRM|nr:hypothetical protein CHL78_017135 [Romboutsia weinsteinii]